MEKICQLCPIMAYAVRTVMKKKVAGKDRIHFSEVTAIRVANFIKREKQL